MNYTIYKLVCKDEDVTGIYVGSTKKFVKRKNVHRCDSKKEKKTNKLYKCVNSNGGIQNWDFVVLDICTCETQSDAFIREQIWYDELKPELNTYKPQINLEEKRMYKLEHDKVYYIENKEKIAECKKQNYVKNTEKILQRKSEKIYCVYCDIYYSRGGKSRHYRFSNHLDNLAKIAD